MEVVDLGNWEAFEEQLKILESKHNKRGFLYRGQGNHIHPLKTTLERNGRERLSLEQYHRLISVVRPQVESFTGKNWSILSSSDFHDLLDKSVYSAFGTQTFQSTYSYMTYLRHYGFPSPLLDWTSSPQIAAFFAFRNASNCEEKVSIYVYLESPSGIKLSSSNEPHIQVFGPYVRTDRRHFIQQSRYTVCFFADDKKSYEWCYVPHEDAFARNDEDQDFLWKFNLPSSERLKVLKILDNYNINAFSLIGSDESLMETTALREIDFKPERWAI